MKQIGGFFTYEPLPKTENHYFETLCPTEGAFRYLMSGRCANYYVLKDICLTDTKKKAYVPVYTCETVLEPYIKAGFELLFYDVAKDMTPVFDPRMLECISVINLCGYYGFSNYDRDFIKQCRERGITIVEDTTHSLFSDNGIDPYCDYVVGSLRKWIGVPGGGFAIKKKGAFSLPVHPPDETHLSMRVMSMKVKQVQMSLHSEHPCMQALEKANNVFWDAEMLLRRTFDCHGSDPESEAIIRHYDFEHMKKQRRINYRYLLDYLPDHPCLSAVFPGLPQGTVPSHFTVYARNRDGVQKYLDQRGIKATAYWPQGPMVDTRDHKDAAYIYSHVLSLPCDQRYAPEDMEYICKQIADMPCQW